VKIRRILVPLDFSVHSMRALETAADLAKTFEAELVLMHAYHLPPLFGPPEELVIPPDFAALVRDAAARRLEKAAKQLEGRGLRVSTRLTDLPPAEAIVGAAKEIGADLIVMSTRGLTGLKHLVLGSVAERTLRHAPCPVLALKPAEP